MSAAGTLTLYTGAILLGALAGGALPLFARVRRSDLLLSFSAGVMLGAAFFHMLPEAVEGAGAAAVPFVLVGFLLLYLLERFVLVHVCAEPGPNARLFTAGAPLPHHAGEHDHEHHGRADPDPDGTGCGVHTLGVAAWLGMSAHTLVDGFALAAASVALTQISQFLMTIVLLVVISLVTGARAALQVPSGTVIAAVGIVVVVVGGAMAIPPVRRWVLGRIGPMWRQTWPRLVQMFSQPRRFAVPAVGNLLVTVCYLGAFWASLQAFGRELPLIALALIYLLGNTAGALVPTPGGLGAVEGALIGALSATGGVPIAIATSVVVLFRGLTFWARIPFGWLSMRVLQRQGEL